MPTAYIDLSGMMLEPNIDTSVVVGMLRGLRLPEKAIGTVMTEARVAVCHRLVVAGPDAALRLAQAVPLALPLLIDIGVFGRLVGESSGATATALNISRILRCVSEVVAERGPEAGVVMATSYLLERG